MPSLAPVRMMTLPASESEGRAGSIAGYGSLFLPWNSRVALEKASSEACSMAVYAVFRLKFVGCAEECRRFRQLEA